MTATAVILGRLGSDPERKQAKDGKNFATFSVAVNQFRNGAEDTDWFDVAAFGDTGRFVVEHVKKGSAVFVSGPLSIDKWEKDGVKQQKPRVVADSVRFANLGDGKKKEEGGDFAAGGQSDW